MFNLALAELLKSLVYQVSWSLFSESLALVVLNFSKIVVLVVIWVVLIRQYCVYLQCEKISLLDKYERLKQNILLSSKLYRYTSLKQLKNRSLKMKDPLSFMLKNSRTLRGS